MSYDDVKKVWMNGRLVDFADAKIHAFAHVFHYGSAMFEGARVYKTRRGSAAFRHRRAHQADVRLLQGLPDGDPVLGARNSGTAIFETIRANGFDECYIRPVVYRGMGALGVNPFKSADRRPDRRLALGQVPRRRGDRRRRRRVRLLLEPDGSEHVPGHGQGDGQLPELAADQDGGDHQRLHGRDRARQRRPDLGGQRREHLSRLRRKAPDAAARPERSCRGSRATRS